MYKYSQTLATGPRIFESLAIRIQNSPNYIHNTFPIRIDLVCPEIFPRTYVSTSARTDCSLLYFRGAWDSKKLPGMVRQFRDQTYRSLKREAISSGEPFVDPTFPPNNDSIFNSPPDGTKHFYEWRRPGVRCCFFIL